MPQAHAPPSGEARPASSPALRHLVAIAVGLALSVAITALLVWPLSRVISPEVREDLHLPLGMLTAAVYVAVLGTMGGVIRRVPPLRRLFCWCGCAEDDA